jgi:3-isopropylmalate/(R)-2-methylmalate dehydratase small subunit
VTSRIEHIEGVALAMPGDDIDTDRIIPARYLKAITFDGLEAHVFADDRAHVAAAGGQHPFDDPAGRDARVLFVNANFGCGSSREHAPQAIARRGIRAIVGESFAEIFAGNALMIGLPCLTATRDDMRKLMDAAQSSPGVEAAVDLRTGRVTAGSVSVTASMPAAARDAFLSGTWDATASLLENYEAVEQREKQLPY